MNLSNKFQSIYILSSDDDTVNINVLENEGMIQVKDLIPEKWRSFDDAIKFYGEISDGIKELKNKRK